MPNTGTQALLPRFVPQDEVPQQRDINQVLELIAGTFGMPVNLQAWNHDSIYQQLIRPLDPINGLAQRIEDDTEALLWDVTKSGLTGGVPTTLYPSLDVEASDGGTLNLQVTSAGVYAAPKMGVGQAIGSDILGVTGKTKLTGDLWVTDQVGIGQDATTDALGVTGDSRFTGKVGIGQAVGAEVLGVTGASKFTGAVVITTDLTVDTNTLVVDSTNNRVGMLTAAPLCAWELTGTGRITQAASFTPPATGQGIEVGYTAGVGIVTSYDRSATLAKPLWLFGDPVIVSELTTTKLGFFGHATGAAQQTVTGSRGGNAALASLLTKLAAYGLIVDSSS